LRRDIIFPLVRMERRREKRERKEEGKRGWRRSGLGQRGTSNSNNGDHSLVVSPHQSSVHYSTQHSKHGVAQQMIIIWLGDEMGKHVDFSLLSAVCVALYT